MALTQISTQGIKDGTITGTDLATSFATTGDFTFTGATSGYNAVWDKSDNALKFADNAKLIFGDHTNGDAQISHDGTKTFINAPTAPFVLFTPDLEVRNSATNALNFKVDTDGAVELYYGTPTSKKFETSSAGVSVTGNISATGHFRPTVDDNSDLGSSILRFRNQYISASGSIDFLDNGKIKMGNSDDLQIYHDGSDSYVSQTGTGNLILQGNASNNIAIRAKSGQEGINLIPDGAVEVYHSGSKKIETSSTGATVTGTLIADGLTVGDAERIKLGNSSDLELFHTGTETFIKNLTGTLNINNDGVTQIKNYADNEFIAKFTSGGSVELYHANSKKFETTSVGATVTGFLGIGITNPDSPLEVLGTGPSLATIHHSDGGTDDEARIMLGALSSNPPDQRGAGIAALNNGAGHDLLIKCSSSHSAGPSTKMIIASDGNVGIGKTSTSLDIDGSIFFGNGQQLQIIKSGSGGKAMNIRRRTNVGTLIQFDRISAVGSISCSNTSTSYNTSSDYRLKENVVTLTDAITRLKTLKPYRFNFIADKTLTVDGFIAHEVTAVPEAVTGTKDAVITQEMIDNEEYEKEQLGDIIPQSIDQAKLVPLLVAAVQEAIGKIEVLETEVAALKAG